MAESWPIWLLRVESLRLSAWCGENSRFTPLRVEKVKSEGLTPDLAFFGWLGVGVTEGANLDAPSSLSHAPAQQRATRR